jgi:DNA-binding CsgD family transcriptional regulator
MQAEAMLRHGPTAAISVALGRQIDRLTDLRPRTIHYAIAAVLALVSAVFAEVHFADLGHGTHLLFFLLVACAAAVRWSPGPAALGVVVAAVASAVAAFSALGPPDPIQKVLSQLAMFLLVGLGYLAVLSAAISARRRLRLVSSVPRPIVEPLTARELDVLRLAAAGMTTEEIGERLYLSHNTVKTHLSHSYAKLDARSRSQAVRAALHCGCLTSDDICPHASAPAAAGKTSKG